MNLWEARKMKSEKEILKSVICINKKCPNCRDTVDAIDLTNCSISEAYELENGYCKDFQSDAN